YFGISAGRQIRSVLDGAKTRDEALRDHAAFSAAHRHAYGLALALQRLVPALPPPVLTLGLRAFTPFVDRAFSWYLAQAEPGMANAWERTQTSSRRAGRPLAKAT
ncbi:MAG TPA: hypothetical protein VF587_03925, partial [Solirubrobacteraceae bacterium]